MEWKPLPSFDHDAWLRLIKWEDEMLAQSFVSLPIDQLRIVRDILIKRMGEIEHWKETSEMMDKITSMKRDDELEDAFESAKRAVEEKQKNIPEELEIVNGLIAKRERETNQ